MSWYGGSVPKNGNSAQWDIIKKVVGKPRQLGDFLYSVGIMRTDERPDKVPVIFRAKKILVSK